jgi:hypothetical protein
MSGGWPGLPSRMGILRARIWLAVIVVVSVVVLVALHLTMSYLELGWCDDRHDLPGACRVVRAPVDWFKTAVMGMPDEGSCNTPLADLRERGARVWVTGGTFMPDGGALLSTRFVMKRGAAPQKLVRLLPDGQVDTNFEPGQGCAPQFRMIRRLNDGTVALLGGSPDGTDDLTRLTLIGGDGIAKVIRARGACGVSSSNIRDAAADRRGGLILTGSFESGPENAVVARLERDGRCVFPFEAPPQAVVPDSIAGVATDGRVTLKLRPPHDAPLLRYLEEGSLDLRFAAALQQTVLETGMPLPSEVESGADGGTALVFQPGLGVPTVMRLDPQGNVVDGVPATPEVLDRRVTGARPLAGGNVVMTVDGRSRITAETLRVPPARLWRMLPDGNLDEAFAAATKDLAPGAGDLRVLDVGPDGRMLVLAYWYGVPPAPYSWPWPAKNEIYVLDRDGKRVERFRAPDF